MIWRFLSAIEHWTDIFTEVFKKTCDICTFLLSGSSQLKAPHSLHETDSSSQSASVHRYVCWISPSVLLTRHSVLQALLHSFTNYQQIYFSDTTLRHHQVCSLFSPPQPLTNMLTSMSTSSAPHQWTSLTCKGSLLFTDPSKELQAIWKIQLPLTATMLTLPKKSYLSMCPWFFS